MTHFFDDIQPVPQSPAQVEDAAIQLERDFVEIVREETGMHESLAAVFAQVLVRGLRKRLGGSDLYIPAADKSERDSAIRRAFTGANLHEVMARYQVSRSTVYRLANIRDPQMSLPAASNPISPL